MLLILYFQFVIINLVCIQRVLLVIPVTCSDFRLSEFDVHREAVNQLCCRSLKNLIVYQRQTCSDVFKKFNVVSKMYFFPQWTWSTIKFAFACNINIKVKLSVLTDNQSNCKFMYIFIQSYHNLSRILPVRVPLPALFVHIFDSTSF